MTSHTAVLTMRLQHDLDSRVTAPGATGPLGLSASSTESIEQLRETQNFLLELLQAQPHVDRLWQLTQDKRQARRRRNRRPAVKLSEAGLGPKSAAAQPAHSEPEVVRQGASNDRAKPLVPRH